MILQNFINSLHTDKNGMVEIYYHVAQDFLLPRHYSGRTPSISKAFGWYIGTELKAVCTFGKPASPPLCESVCGGGVCRIGI